MVEALPVLGKPNVADLKIDRLSVEADDKTVDEQIGNLAKGAKSWSDAPKKHAAATGDLVVMDFEGTIDGEAFDGGTGEDLSIELGTNRLIPGFEDRTGRRQGWRREVDQRHLSRRISVGKGARQAGFVQGQGQADQDGQRRQDRR